MPKTSGKVSVFVLLTTAVVFVVCAMKNGPGAELYLNAVLLCLLCYCSVTDIKSRTVYDKALLAAAAARVIPVLFDFSMLTVGKLAANGLLVSFPVLLIVLALERITGRYAMGGGDIKLLFVTGLYLGGAKTLLALMMGCFAAAVYGSITKNRELPLVPFLALGAAVSMVWGDAAISGYMALIL